MKNLLLLFLCVPLIGLGQCISGDCQNGYGTWIGDELKYVGEFKDYKFHGQGTYTFLDGTQNSGTWLNGVLDGKVSISLNDGSKYIGLY